MHVIGTAGHVDHGKSALVKRLTGIDPDRLSEEKERGLTIDLGFAWLTTPSGREVAIIDVPGHERFIKNMLAGAGGISICMFVVAANEGWMPQSAEHLAALDVLGINHGVVALTKADLVDGDTLELMTAEIEDRLAPTTLRGARVVACSATSGRGLSDLVAALDDELAAAPAAADVDRPRLWVDRSFTITGAGTVVTGTLTGGVLRTGGEVDVLPADQRAQVRSIQSHKRAVESIGPGNRVALNLAGARRDSVRRGDAIVRPRQWRPTAMVDAMVRVASEEVVGRRHTLTDRGAHLLYCGSAETPVRLSLLDRSELGPGETGYARLWLRNRLPLARGDRFVLRDVGRVLTFGGGAVLDPLPPRARPREHADSLARLVGASDEEALRILVERDGSIAKHDAFLRTGLQGGPGTVALGDVLVSDRKFAELHDAAVAIVQRRHESQPLERGISREALRSELRLRDDVFDALLDASPKLIAAGPVVHLASFSVKLDPAAAKARDALLDRLEGAGFQPPQATDLDVPSDLVRALVDAGELVDVGGFYLTGKRARAARETVRNAIAEHGPLTVAEVRDLLGTTRKYAVPLCEWLDRTGATLRKGDVRLLGPNP